MMKSGYRLISNGFADAAKSVQGAVTRGGTHMLFDGYTVISRSGKPTVILNDAMLTSGDAELPGTDYKATPINEVKAAMIERLEVVQHVATKLSFRQ